MLVASKDAAAAAAVDEAIFVAEPDNTKAYKVELVSVTELRQRITEEQINLRRYAKLVKRSLICKYVILNFVVFC